MLRRPETCVGCSLHDNNLCSGFAPPFGRGSLGVLVIAEALGEHEAREGRPLVPKAQAGSLFARALRRMRIDEQQLLIMNTVNCFPGGVKVNAANIEKAYKRWYEGDLVKVITAHNKFSGTPNHPVLTQRGWVALGLLKQGDYLLRSVSGEWVSLGNPNVQCQPPSFVELYSALASTGVREGTIGRNEDFHGDGIEAEVEIVTLYGLLRYGVQALSLEQFRELTFKAAHNRTGSLLSLCASNGPLLDALNRIAVSSSGSVRSGDKMFPAFLASMLESNDQRLRPISDFDPLGFEALLQGCLSDVEALRQWLQTLPIEIAADEIVDIERRKFTGHVYNLQTKAGQYIANGYIVSNCRPQGNRLENEWYEDAAVAHCRQYVDAAIERFRPGAILTLGNVALRAATGLAGEGRSVTSLRGYVLPSTTYKRPAGEALPIVPSLHPSFISRGQEKYLGVLIHDIGKAISVARGELVEGRDFIYDPQEAISLEYYCNPHGRPVEYLLERADDPEGIVGFDIETDHTSKGKKGEDEYELAPEDNITQIQFSVRPGEAFIFPWDDRARDITARIVRGRATLLGQNSWLFDLMKLRREGIIPRAVGHDLMQMFHHLQPDLPKDLQTICSFYGAPFPWKHLEITDPYYAGPDVDNLQRAFPKLRADMQRRGVWDSYMEMVLGLRPILGRMEDRGIRIDLDRRAEFKVELETEKQKAYDWLQTAVPEIIKPKQTYKEWPQEASPYVKQIQQQNIIIGPKGGRTLPVVKIDKATADHHIVLSDRERAELLERLGSAWRYTNGDLFRVDPYLPNSTQHLKKLIQHYGEPVPVNLDYDETTARPELEKLIERLHKEVEKAKSQTRITAEKARAAERKLELVNRIEQTILYRQLNKMYSTYVEGWKVGPDGCVHTTFTFAPATWQLSSKDPNVQNGPAHGELAKKFQRLQVASPSRTIIAVDYGGCHLKTLAFEMEDLNYYKMACIDGHSTVAAIALKLIKPEIIFAMEEGEWREYVKWFRSDADRERLRNKQFKPALLGIQLGLMGRHLYDLNRKSFASQKDAQNTIDAIKGIFPKIPKWQTHIRDLAHRQGFLLSRYGGIRWFWSMRRWDAKSQQDVAGDDAEAALAFPVQNDAFGKKRESMLDLAAEGLDERYGMNNDIHDASYFDCPNEYLEEAISNIKRIMESPARKLKNDLWPDGLIISTEIKIGPSLGELKKVAI